MARRPLPASLNRVHYKDFDLQFRRHPTTGKLFIKKDDDAIKQAIKNLILTNFSERPFRPYFGGNVRRRLFDNFDTMTAEDFKNQIVQAIQNYEPRVIVNKSDVVITQYQNQNLLVITIKFRNIANLSDVTLDINLNRVR